MEVHVPQGEGAVFSMVSGTFDICMACIGFNRRNDAEECIRLVCKKLTIFPYAEYIVEFCVLLLSYDIVRFKIEVGVEEKCMCKNVTQHTQHGDWAVPLCRLRCYFHELDLSAQFGVIILGLCYPSNSLFEYSASTFG